MLMMWNGWTVWSHIIARFCVASQRAACQHDCRRLQRPTDSLQGPAAIRFMFTLLLITHTCTQLHNRCQQHLQTHFTSTFWESIQAFLVTGLSWLIGLCLLHCFLWLVFWPWYCLTFWIHFNVSSPWHLDGLLKMKNTQSGS